MFLNSENYWQALQKFVKFRQTGTEDKLDDAANFILLAGYFKERNEIENRPEFSDFYPVWELTNTNKDIWNMTNYIEMKTNLQKLTITNKENH